MSRRILLRIVWLLQEYLPASRVEIQIFNLESWLHGSKLKVYKYKDRLTEPVFYATRNDVTGLQHIFPILNRGRSFRNGFQEAGYSIAKTYAIPTIVFEENDVVIDVGANLGNLKFYFDYSLRMKIRYFAIEPGKFENFCLNENLGSDPLTTVCNSAVGKVSGVQKFSYAPKSGDSSLGEIGNEIYSYDVKVDTLESLINKWNLNESGIKLLKMDAEGYELEALEGAREKLKLIDFIAVDLGFERGLEQRSTAPEVIHFLLTNGFVIENVGLPDSLRFLFRRKEVPATVQEFIFSH